MRCNSLDSARTAHGAKQLHRYRSCGLVIESEIPLSPLRADTTTGSADIAIRLGAVEPGTAAAARYRRSQIYDQFRYEAARGCDVAIELLPDADLSNVADLIVSRVLTAVIYQRGLLPLHASAVATPTGLVAICGVSGAGKSTLAAVLASRGHALVADDLLVASPSGGGMVASPAAHGLKLSAASLDRIGRTSAGLAVANRVEAKYYLPVDTLPPPATPIARLVQLRDGPAGVTPLSTVQAASGWRNCIRMPDLMDQAPDPAALWRQWLALVCAVDNVAVSHGGRMGALDGIAAGLEGTHELIPARLGAYG